MKASLNKDNVKDIRQHSRQVVRELGFMRPQHDASSLGHTQIHALLELEQAGPLLGRELAERLKLEKSSISRLVEGLHERSLLYIEPSCHDKRKKLLHLSGPGRDELEHINSYTNQYVERVLNYLSPNEQDTVVAGLRAYATALEMANKTRDVVVRKIKAEDDPKLFAIIMRCLEEFGAAREGFAFTDPEIKKMSKHYRSKKSCYLVAVREDELLGGGGIGPFKGATDTVCELKKMYLSTNTRGLGLGRRLINELIQKARDAGYRQCYIETLASMQAANRLYQNFGFVELDSPMGNTGHTGCDTWYLKTL